MAENNSNQEDSLNADKKFTSMTRSYSEITASGMNEDIAFQSQESDSANALYNQDEYLENFNRFCSEQTSEIEKQFKADVCIKDDEKLSVTANEEFMSENVSRLLRHLCDENLMKDQLDVHCIAATSHHDKAETSEKIPAIDPSLLNELELHSRGIASSMDALIENLTGTLHSISSLSVEYIEAYRDSVCKTCDAVDSNIKSMYQLMAKVEELSKSMKPVYKLRDQIKEVKRLLDLFENVTLTNT